MIIEITKEKSEEIKGKEGDAEFWEGMGIHKDEIKPFWEEIAGLENPELMKEEA